VALLDGRSRSRAGRTAPAHGLALASVSYARRRVDLAAGRAEEAHGDAQPSD
jgi:hypothetical protein